MNTVILDLAGLTTKEQVFGKFEEIFEFHVMGLEGGKTWGMNWDALADCMRHLEDGSTSKKFNFPLKIEIHNWTDFKNSEDENFSKLAEILETVKNECRNQAKELEIMFM